MIIDDADSYFIFVYHPDIYYGKVYTTYQGRRLTNREVLEFWGKWIILGEKSWLDALARNLDPYVENEIIPCIKYDRKPPENLGVEECVMMVYCDKRAGEEVWQILNRHGVKLKAWVSERETMEMWRPGGMLLERWIISRGLNETEVRSVRADAQSRLGYVFDHPDELFQPWAQ
jgi:hypothetical protein